MKFIRPSLLEPGQSFVISDFVKENYYGSGSKGYLSIIQSGHETYQNLAKVLAIMTRKGKGGKPRIEKCELIVPVFIYFENEENFRKIMPSPGDVRNYSAIDSEEAEGETTDLLQVPAVEFIGWASAMVTQLHHIAHKARYGTWPEDQSHPLNRFRRMPDLYNDDRERIDALYSERASRLHVIDQIRKVDSSLFKMRLGSRLRYLDIISNAAEFLVYVNKGEFIPQEQEDKTNEFKFTNDQKLLDENLKYHKEVYGDLQKVCSAKKISMM